MFMKNIFKKTAGVMIIASMLCAIMTTGCTASESNKASDNSATESSTKVEEATEVEDATESAESTEPENNTDVASVELAQQTKVDEVTGVEVSGMLPVGADLVSMVDFISVVDLYDRFDNPYSVEGDFKKFDGIIGDYDTYQADRKVDNIAKFINQRDWANYEGTAGGMLDVDIYFIKDSEVIEFESDMTITMPFNYRRGLITGGVEDEPVVKHYDYDDNVFTDIELVPAEATPKGMFQFKAKEPGLFFLGGESDVDGLLEFYEGHYE